MEIKKVFSPASIKNGNKIHGHSQIIKTHSLWLESSTICVHVCVCVVCDMNWWQCYLLPQLLNDRNNESLIIRNISKEHQLSNRMFDSGLVNHLKDKCLRIRLIKYQIWSWKIWLTLSLSSDMVFSNYFASKSWCPYPWNGVNKRKSFNIHASAWHTVGLLNYLFHSQPTSFSLSQRPT